MVAIAVLVAEPVVLSLEIFYGLLERADEFPLPAALIVAVAHGSDQSGYQFLVASLRCLRVLTASLFVLPPFFLAAFFLSFFLLAASSEVEIA